MTSRPSQETHPWRKPLVLVEIIALVVLVGSNLAWCHPVLHQRISAAKAARPNMRVVNIDPRRTASSDLADLHLQIAPDGGLDAESSRKLRAKQGTAQD